MSILVTAFVVGCSAAAGRWIAARALQKPPNDAPAPGDVPNGGGADAAPKPAPKPKDPPKPVKVVHDLSSFPCKLGDVVVLRTGDEAWLAGGVVLSEGGAAIAVVYFAPEAGGDRSLYVRPHPDDEIVWLTPIPDGELSLGAEPPNALEHKNERFERLRRLPLRAERMGAGAPDFGEAVVLADYKSAAGERLVALFPAVGNAKAWRGELLAPGMFDVLGGENTLTS